MLDSGPRLTGPGGSEVCHEHQHGFWLLPDHRPHRRVPGRHRDPLRARSRSFGVVRTPRGPRRAGPAALAWAPAGRKDHSRALRLDRNARRCPSRPTRGRSRPEQACSSRPPAPRRTDHRGTFPEALVPFRRVDQGAFFTQSTPRNPADWSLATQGARVRGGQSGADQLADIGGGASRVRRLEPGGVKSLARGSLDPLGVETIIEHPGADGKKRA